MKFYKGHAKAARHYLERDRSRADDYYLRDGAGLAERFVATPDGVTQMEDMEGDKYERWVAGIDLDSHLPKGRIREDANANRFAEITINGPKTWSLAAALNPEVSAALDAAQDEAAKEVISYLATHSTTRVGGRGKQVQVPVKQIEAAVIRHYTSRAGDPHRHLHVQINARVWAAEAWRGIHTVGVRDMIEAINGIGHAAVATNPGFRQALADAGFTIDSRTSEIRELQPFVGAFSARTAQIAGNVDRYEATWRRDHPGQEPGPHLREVWDRRAWAEARPDKVIPQDGADLVARWNQELLDLGYDQPTMPVAPSWVLPGMVDRDEHAAFVITQLGAMKSAWNAGDVRGAVEVLLARVDLVADPAARNELAEDITARAVGMCEPLLSRPDVPEHVRSYTSRAVLAVETDILTKLDHRASGSGARSRLPDDFDGRLDPGQQRAVAALCGSSPLVVVEGAAGTGKTTTLTFAHHLLARQRHRMLIATPTLKAAQVAARETRADAQSAAWVIHQYGFRWTNDGHRARTPSDPLPQARLRSGDLLVVDEAGMLDQDTAQALLTIADETGARVAFLGDRHQLPAVGRGGVFDHAHTWAQPRDVVSMDTIHRFTNPKYAQLTAVMRTAKDSGAVFDWLHRNGHILIHRSDIERTAAVAAIAATTGDMVIADTRDQVASVNAAVRHHAAAGIGVANSDVVVAVTARGEELGVGDSVATRLNDPELGVANRQTWIITGTSRDGALIMRPTDGGRNRHIPADYAAEHVELAYATTVHGAQGDTVTRAHLILDHHTGAASAYVGMTRGREFNTAHLVADTLDDARQQWVDTFNRDRADLGPAHARQLALEAIDTYGPAPEPRHGSVTSRYMRPSSSSPLMPESPGIGP